MHLELKQCKGRNITEVLNQLPFKVNKTINATKYFNKINKIVKRKLSNKELKLSCEHFLASNNLNALYNVGYITLNRKKSTYFNKITSEIIRCNPIQGIEETCYLVFSEDNILIDVWYCHRKEVSNKLKELSKLYPMKIFKVIKVRTKDKFSPFFILKNKELKENNFSDFLIFYYDYN